MGPAELLLGFARIAEQQFHLRRADMEVMKAEPIAGFD